VTGSARIVVAFPNDDDFILFHVPEKNAEVASDAEITELTAVFNKEVARKIEEVHGEDIADLFDIFVGRAHVLCNPKLRLERQIYRGIREAAGASKSLEHRDQAKKIADLRETLRTGGLYIDYHPIVVTDTQKIFGYEALAGGTMPDNRPAPTPNPALLRTVRRSCSFIGRASEYGGLACQPPYLLQVTRSRPAAATLAPAQQFC